MQADAQPVSGGGGQDPLRVCQREEPAVTEGVAEFRQTGRRSRRHHLVGDGGHVVLCGGGLRRHGVGAQQCAHHPDRALIRGLADEAQRPQLLDLREAIPGFALDRGRAALQRGSQAAPDQ